MKTTQLDHKQHIPGTKKYPLCLLAHNIDTPINIGSFFRIADALGIEKIYLTGSSTPPPHAKINKTSRGTEKYVAYTYEKNPLDIVLALKKAAYKIISLEITSTSISLEDFSINSGEKICLILGAENHGVSQELLDASDVSLHIPMLGNNSSMNVANACAIACYALTKKL